jgi:hypothetical protein
MPLSSLALLPLLGPTPLIVLDPCAPRTSMRRVRVQWRSLKQNAEGVN